MYKIATKADIAKQISNVTLNESCCCLRVSNGLFYLHDLVMLARFVPANKSGPLSIFKKTDKRQRTRCRYKIMMWQADDQIVEPC